MEMSPENKDKAIAGTDAPQSDEPPLSASTKMSEPSPSKRKKIAKDSASSGLPPLPPASAPTKMSAPYPSPRKRQKIAKKDGSPPSPNKRKKIAKGASPPSTPPPRISQQQPQDPFYDVYNRSPSHNEYLEHALIMRKPKIEEPEIPDVPLPIYEEPPRSFGGLEEIVESAKFVHRRKD